MVMNIRVFESPESTKPFYTDHADIKKKGNNFRYSISAYDLLMNEQYLIMVNKTSKEIMYAGRDLKTEKRNTAPFDLSMDSIFNVLGNPVLTDTEGPVYHYTLKRDKGAIAQIDFFLNKEKKYMEKIEYRYRERQFVSIIFENFETSPVYAADTFSEKNYLIFTNDNVKKAAPFQRYKIIQNEN
jgi:hypothetical protein